MRQNVSYILAFIPQMIITYIALLHMKWRFSLYVREMLKQKKIQLVSTVARVLTMREKFYS